MLPFFNKKRDAGIILARIGKKPIEGVTPEISGPDDKEDSDPMLEMMAEDIIRALDDKSPQKLARALKEFFLSVDILPDEEQQKEDQV